MPNFQIFPEIRIQKIQTWQLVLIRFRQVSADQYLPSADQKLLVSDDRTRKNLFVH